MHNIFVDFLKSIRIVNVLAIASAQWIVSIALKESICIAIFYTFLLSSMGYLQNNILDYNLDTLGKKRTNQFLTAYFNPLKNLIFGIHIFVSISTIYFLWNGNIIHGCMILANWFLLNLYNYFLKKYPLIGNITVALLSSNVILYIFWLQDNLNPTNGLFLGFIFVLSLLREIVKDLEDKDVDRQYSYQTLPILLPLNQIKIVTVLLTLATLYLLIGLDIPAWGKGLVASLLLLQSIFTFNNRYSQASLFLKVVFFVGILMLGMRSVL
jgi:4-hydroxybenzoate polyprenyltransferase